ncbi:Mitochondrial FAD-linked sulfhydryl oxidase ERV1 [Golovinomyces cichoracearum]|uniref:Sulfhydryl oxidase n=1 Tax=Golovinomyces cichoracearum TaxID=62708 RepID=A0A420J2A6_9PEZI|nr:Mitochondrial FAD-linked sulfhydryl oxidase ERV1 [Golovinomyces cichoracearum]
MADDERGSEESRPVASSPTDQTNSVILGKDGKPCRACSSSAAFSSWASKAKKTSKIPNNSVTASSSTLSSRDCPPDVEALGRASWTLLHSITASYPVNPSSTQKTEVIQFLKLFAKLYPCWVCATDFDAYIEKKHIRADSRDQLGFWMCEAHNSVNKKLGKNIFDCQKWEERWRTGWKDGSCD